MLLCTNLHCVVAGDMGVGKSCLLHQFTEKKCKSLQSLRVSYIRILPSLQEILVGGLVLKPLYAGHHFRDEVVTLVEISRVLVESLCGVALY